MPHVISNGIRLAYKSSGQGDPILFISGSASGGDQWTMYQTPALHRAGYRTITFDNRGVPPSDAPPGRYLLADMVADTAGLIETLRTGPCHLIGTSLGASIAQELLLDRPDLVRSAVLIGTRSRPDILGAALAAASRSLAESAVAVPPAYHAVTSALRMLAPATLNDDRKARTWLDLFELTSVAGAPVHGQAWADTVTDRRGALRTTTTPCRVIAFADDLMSPPYLCKETAEAIPDCDYVEIAGCGHLGYLERPDEVNAALIEFLDRN